MSSSPDKQSESNIKTRKKSVNSGKYFKKIILFINIKEQIELKDSIESNHNDDSDSQNESE